jgi:hypothetical protein
VVPATRTAAGCSARAASAADWTVEENSPALITVNLARSAVIGAWSAAANWAQTGAPHSRYAIFVPAAGFLSSFWVTGNTLGCPV